MDYNLILSLLGFALSGIVTACCMAWWLSNQFKEMRQLVYTKFDQLMKTFSDKLEYHERHDDQRFHNIHNDIWAIRVRNAARDGNEIQPVVSDIKRK